MKNSRWSVILSSCHLVNYGEGLVIRVSIIGASGYVGGELARLLLFHPEVELVQVTSERLAGKPFTSAHPNLRGHTALQFVPADRVEPCDLLFLALPHGEAARKIEQFAGLAPRVVDCSADFRLRDADAYARWYGAPHPAPEWLDKFVYGLRQVGELTDTNEVLRAAWFSADDVWAMIAANQARDGLTLTALLWYFARLRVTG